MPTSDRAGVWSVSARDEGVGDFHSQDLEVSVFADRVIVEPVVGVC